MSRTSLLSVAAAALFIGSIAPLGAEPASEPAPVHGDDHLYAADAPVYLEAGHVQPVQGKAVLNIDDMTFTQVGGLVCQGPPGLVPCPPLHPYVSDDSWIFCNGITLDVEQGWDPSMDLWVYIGSPFDTWALGFGVDCEDPRPGTVGHLRHFP